MNSCIGANWRVEIEVDIGEIIQDRSIQLILNRADAEVHKSNAADRI